MSTNLATVTQAPQRASILAKIAERYNVEPNRMLDTLKATAFKGQVSNEQMMALLIVADQYKLNPFTKEIYAFPDKNNGVVPVVGVDGWARIINEHQAFDGMSFESDDKSCTCTMYRKDRTHPIVITEYMAECRRGTQPWQSHPKRMLRHKAMIQCARMAFGFAGIYDPDEAERIADMGMVDEVPPAKLPAGASTADKLKAAALKKSATGAARQTIDNETGEISSGAAGTTGAADSTIDTTFDPVLMLERIKQCADIAVLQMIGDDVDTMPDCPSKTELLAAIGQRDKEISK